jgi:hypothetical protein
MAGNVAPLRMHGRGAAPQQRALQHMDAGAAPACQQRSSSLRQRRTTRTRRLQQQQQLHRGRVTAAARWQAVTADLSAV